MGEDLYSGHRHAVTRIRCVKARNREERKIEKMPAKNVNLRDMTRFAPFPGQAREQKLSNAHFLEWDSRTGMLFAMVGLWVDFERRP